MEGVGRGDSSKRFLAPSARIVRYARSVARCRFVDDTYRVVWDVRHRRASEVGLEEGRQKAIRPIVKSFPVRFLTRDYIIIIDMRA